MARDILVGRQAGEPGADGGDHAGGLVQALGDLNLTMRAQKMEKRIL